MGQNKIVCRKKGVNGIFKPAQPPNLWDASIQVYYHNFGVKACDKVSTARSEDGSFPVRSRVKNSKSCSKEFGRRIILEAYALS